LPEGKEKRAMSCDKYQDKLYEYIYGLLTPAARMDIDAHLADCDDCRRALKAARVECTMLKQWSAPTAPEGLAERTIAAVGTDAPEAEAEIIPIERDIKWLGGRRFWRIAALLLAVIAVGITGYSVHIANLSADPQQAAVYGQWRLAPGDSTAWRVRVWDAETNDAVPDARVKVRLEDESGGVVFASIALPTDSLGFAVIESAMPDDLPEGEYTLRIVANSDAGRSELTQSISVDRSFRVLVSTDKPIYQPGQTIHIRALSLATDDLRPAAGRDAVIEVQDAKGNKVFKKVFTGKDRTSEYGIVSADFVLADQVNEGAYTVRAVVGDTESERTVSVERYKLPKFKIDAECDRPYYEPGQNLACDISVQYTFGEPVSDAVVTVEAQEFIEEFRTFTVADALTNKEGRARIELPLKDYFAGSPGKQGDALVSLKITVRDAAGHELVKTQDVTVTTQPLRVEVFPESGSLVQGVENIVYILTAYADGRPARTKLTVGGNTQQVETSEAGIARVKLTPHSAGMQLTILAEDEAGLRTNVTRTLRIDAMPETLLLRTDKAIYRTGETAGLTVLTPANRARVFVDVVKSGRTMLMKAVDVEGGRADIALDLPHDLFGTLQLHAWRIMPDGSIVADTRVVQVNRAGTLGIAAELDKESYKPGETALLKFAVTQRDGSPAQAALSLSAVDEAVFALSEMRPGLERVYFALQAELLKPRYELCTQAQLPLPQIVSPQSEPVPEWEEADVLLFSAAEGDVETGSIASLGLQQKRAAVQERQESWFARLKAASLLAPGALLLLLVLPILLYGAWKLIAPRVETDIWTDVVQQTVQRQMRSMILRFIFWAVLLPSPLLIFALALPDRRHTDVLASNLPILAFAAFLVVAVCTVLKFCAAVWPRRSVWHGIPTLRRCIDGLAPRYLIPAIIGATLFLATMQTQKNEFRLMALTGFLTLHVYGVIKGCNALRRGDPTWGAVPALRRLTWFLAPAYVLGTILCTALLVGIDGHLIYRFGYGYSQMGYTTVALVCSIVGLATVAMLAAANLKAIGWTRTKRLFLNAGPKMLVLAPVLLIAVNMSIPPLARARESAGGAFGVLPDMQAPMAAEAKWADGEAWATHEDVYALESERERGPGGASSPTPPRVRRYFPETLLWRPQLITDAQGRASLELPLADSITTWRLSMSAVSAAGQLGASSRGIRVFQDFFVDVDFPVALTQNDVVTVPVAVFNYLDTPQTVRLEVEAADWFELSGESTKSVRIGAREVTAVHFPLTALKPGTHGLTVRAFGEKLNDAVERTVRVLPDGAPVVTTINGRLDENAAARVLIPDHAIDGASDLLVKIYPGAFSQVVEGLDGIFRMPFGCFEQTSSVTYPNILVLDYMRRTKQIQPDVEMKALGYVNAGYQRLLSFEVKGGGFDWYGDPPAHTILTAYGLMEFQDMAKVFDVDPKVIERTRDWLLKKQQSDSSWQADRFGTVHLDQGPDATLRATAYVAWALGDAAPRSALSYIVRESLGVDDAYTLALCANALQSGGRTEAARRVAKDLLALKKTDGKLVYWSSDAQGLMYADGDTLAIEATALAAYALLQLNEGTEAHKALEWLVSKKDSFGTWHSTQTTVLAMRALLAGTASSGGIEEPTHVTVTANGKIAKELTITPETSDVYRLISLREFIKPGQNTVTLESNTAAGLAWQVVGTHYVPWQRTDPRPIESEIDIDLRYDTTELSTSDVLNCDVTVSSRRSADAPMLIVDLGVPPGFDVLPESFDTMRERGELDRYSIAGRQVILYFSRLEAKRAIKFTWSMKARFPVKVKTPASSAYLYYEPEVRAEAEPVQITVTP
jgi:uncharacterized protein YfaS (alpha-2-macroglobulin family)